MGEGGPGGKENSGKTNALSMLKDNWKVLAII